MREGSQHYTAVSELRRVPLKYWHLQFFPELWTTVYIIKGELGGVPDSNCALVLHWRAHGIDIFCIESALTYMTLLLMKIAHDSDICSVLPLFIYMISMDNSRKTRRLTGHEVTNGRRNISLGMRLTTESAISFEHEMAHKSWDVSLDIRWLTRGVMSN
jgi:hypothetical protein